LGDVVWLQGVQYLGRRSAYCGSGRADGLLLLGTGPDCLAQNRSAPVTQVIDSILERLDRIKETLDFLVKERTVKDWYGTEEVAKSLGRAEFTVREWCRNGRIKAEKRMSGRGAFPAWVISHQELLRYQREGLLPSRSA